MRRILHADMDAFFAAVELLRRPELRGRPLVIGGRGDPHARGVVSTATYEARRFGIHSGMPLRTAYRLCPDTVFLPVDFPAYEAVARKFKAALHEFSPVMEDAGIDEAFLDISNRQQPAREIGAAIKRRIFDETGLTCSIGIAPNKLLAKIASDMNKPDGLTVITAADIETRIWPLPVRKLLGVGPKTEARLEELGISTIGDLARQPEPMLVDHFGTALGRYLHRAAHGIDDSALVTHWKPKSTSREITFERDVEDWQHLARTLARLVREVVAGMKAEGYRGRTVTVKLRFTDFDTHTHTTTLPAATSDAGVIRRAAFACLNRFALVKRVRLLGVRVGGLEQESGAA